MAIPTLFVGGCLYYFIFTVMAQHIGLPDVIARDLAPVVEKINIFLAIGLPVVFLILLSWAVVLSYKFLEPLETLEEDIKKIVQGDYSVRVQINQDHDLSPIADVINHLVEQLQRKEVKSSDESPQDSSDR
jgi:signal transduction histidine kinase